MRRYFSDTFEEEGINLILAAWKLTIMLDGKETKFNSRDVCCVSH